MTVVIIMMSSFAGKCPMIILYSVLKFLAGFDRAAFAE
jgi:hypothetical protein